MRRQFTAIACCVLLGLSSIPAVNAAPEGMPVPWQDSYDRGVSAYRDGQYDKACKIFRAIAEGVPGSLESRYYYAISLAQLGRFKDARNQYQSIIDQAPQSEAAQLAQQGIAYLPAHNGLDAPPKFQQNQTVHAPQPAESAQKPTNPFGNMDPEAMQMMMMMGAMGGGGGGNGGFNPMMIPLMQQMQGKGGKSSIPPDMFSSMMVQQMMSDTPMFGGGGDND